MTGKNFTSTTLQLVRDFEGLKLSAYPDAAGYSIGYGSQTYENGQKVKKGDTITQQRAEQLLAYHVNLAANTVNKYVNVPLTQNQFDALTSFVYNVGGGNFLGSTLLKIINQNANDFERISAEFRRWVYSQGVKLSALVDRREQEILVYVQGTYQKKNFGWAVLAAAAVGTYLLTRKRK